MVTGDRGREVIVIGVITRLGIIEMMCGMGKKKSPRGKHRNKRGKLGIPMKAQFLRERATQKQTKEI